MSDPSLAPGAPQPLVVPPVERVVLGLLAASVAVLGGAALTVAIWRLGYIAAITSLAIAFGAAVLYQVAAGAPARKGLVPLVLLIVLGVVLSFFAVVASDLWDAYDLLSVYGPLEVSRLQFITDNLLNGEVLGEYGQDLALFGVFAVLGVVGTIRRLLSGR